MAMTLSSPVFKDGGPVPVKHTCGGRNISPLLTWTDPPQETQSFALIVDDPDDPLGLFGHWILFNIPGHYRGLPEDIPAQGRLADGIIQGKNDFDRIGYGGPCPPFRHSHHYRFRLFALDCKLNLRPGATKEHVIEAMQGHVLAQADLMGTYERQL